MQRVFSDQNIARYKKLASGTLTVDERKLSTTAWPPNSPGSVAWEWRRVAEQIDCQQPSSLAALSFRVSYYP